jgi:serine protease AprX
MTITTHPELAFARGAVSDAPIFTRPDTSRTASRSPKWRPSAALLIVMGLGAAAFVFATENAQNTAEPASAVVEPALEPAVDAADLPLGSMYHVADQIGARELWEQGITGAGVNVALIDTGVAAIDGLLGEGKVVAATDLSSEAGNPFTAMVDNNGHGTHLAGIIAGRETSADPATAAEHPEWFLGVAPDAGIVSVKVGNRDGGVIPGAIAAGIDWAVDNAEALDIRVINLSVGSDATAVMPYRVDPLAAAVQRAWDAGIVVVTAAGNRGAETPGLMTPADNPYVITVGGVRVNDDGIEAAEWTSAGDGVRNPDLAAPGAHIQSLRAPGSDADVNHQEGFIDSETFQGSGSSQSAAMVSGAAALLLSGRPELTNDQVKALLTSAAAPMAEAAELVGAGFLDVASANALPAPDAVQTWSKDHLVAERLYETSSIPVVANIWSGASWWRAGASWWDAEWMRAGASWWRAGASWWDAEWMRAGASWWRAGASWWDAEWMRAGASWWRAGASWWDAEWMRAGASWWRAGASWWDAEWMRAGASWWRAGASWW